MHRSGLKHVLRDLAFAAALFCAPSFWATTAAAQDLGVDEVSLKNGGSIRGTVVSVEPGTKVVILEFGQKDPRTLTWAEVADVQKGKYAPKTSDKVEPGAAGPGYKLPPPAEEVEEEPDEKAAVIVHIDSDEPVRLVRRGATRVVAIGQYFGAFAQHHDVCNSPCGKPIDTTIGHGFFVTGDGVPNSPMFQLKNLGNEVTVDVKAGNRGQRIGGAVMIAVGSVGVVVGALMLPIGALVIEGSLGDQLVIGGGASLGIGAGLIGGGIALVVTGRTKVEVFNGPPKKDADAEALAPPFEIDKRPVAVAPRYWLGEF